MKKVRQIFLCGLLVFVAALAFGGRTARAEAPSIRDEADIISVSNEALMNSQIQQMELQYKTRVMILTVTSLQRSDLKEGKQYFDIEAFTQDYYDFIASDGQEKDGIILCINMEPNNREYCIVTTGKEISRFQRHMDYIYDRIYEDLSRSQYDDAVQTYLDLVETKFRLGFYPPSAGKILIAAAAGLIVAGLAVAGMKGSMQNVQLATSANSYVVPNSFRMRRQNEIFLHSSIVQTARQNERTGSGGGGGGISVGSSGFSHGGGGGRKF